MSEPKLEEFRKGAEAGTVWAPFWPGPYRITEGILEIWMDELNSWTPSIVQSRLPLVQAAINKLWPKPLPFEEQIFTNMHQSWTWVKDEVPGQVRRKFTDTGISNWAVWSQDDPLVSDPEFGLRQAIDYYWPNHIPDERPEQFLASFDVRVPRYRVDDEITELLEQAATQGGVEVTVTVDGKPRYFVRPVTRLSTDLKKLWAAYQLSKPHLDVFTEFSAGWIECSIPYITRAREWAAHDQVRIQATAIR